MEGKLPSRITPAADDTYKGLFLPVGLEVARQVFWLGEGAIAPLAITLAAMLVVGASHN